MDIHSFHFSGGISYIDFHQRWSGELEINGMNEIFFFTINEENIHFDLHYDVDYYTKEETDNLVKTALEDKEIQKSFNYIKESIKALENVKKLDKNHLRIQIKSSYFEKGKEGYTFYFEGMEMEVHITIYTMIKGSEFISSITEFPLAKTNESHFPSFIDIERYYSDQFNQKLIEKLRKDPKVRLRRLFR